MLPDDVFRARLQATITALQYWAPSIADAARLHESETGDYWKITVMPEVASACPFELTLHAETLAVTSVKLPPADAAEDRARLEERIGQVRDLIETLDLLYDAFGRRRFSGDWPKDLAKIQKWLQRETGRFAATG